MNETIDVILMCLGSLLFALLSWAFRQGKCLNLIAGNSFTSPEDHKRPSQRRLGAIMSRLLLVGFATLLINAVGKVAVLLELSELAFTLKIAGSIAWVVFMLMLLWTIWQSLHIRL